MVHEYDLLESIGMQYLSLSMCNEQELIGTFLNSDFSLARHTSVGLLSFGKVLGHKLTTSGSLMAVNSTASSKLGISWIWMFLEKNMSKQ